MKIYNSVSQQIEELDTNKTIKWYVCGPTVYDEAHLGHARTYVMNDMLVQVLRYMNVNVQTIMNITDIDDKIIERSKTQLGDSHKFLELTGKYTQSFVNDLISLGVEIPESVRKVSNLIPEMIQFIADLIERKYAYLELDVEEGTGQSVYFDTEEYNKDYPSFVFERFKNQNEFDDKFLKHKKKSCDFALWKGVKQHEVGWNSPWGKGRPGWHTECATIIKLFNGVDVHTGGIDLCFPHHENEMKQLKSFNITIPSFLHVGHLHIKGLKMSKSLKNFITIKDYLNNDSKRAIQMRYMFLEHHYRSSMDFTEEHFEQSQRQLHLLHNIPETLKNVIKEFEGNLDSYSTIPEQLNQDLHQLIQKNLEHFQNDFQIHLVLRELHDFGSVVFKYLENNPLPYTPLLQTIKKYYDNLFELFGIKNVTEGSGSTIMAEMIVKIRDEVRTQAKETKNKQLWKLSDVIRDDILKPLNYQIEDKKDGPSVLKCV
jgi:cysteinyl-tRNA synthetase